MVRTEAHTSIWTAAFPYNQQPLFASRLSPEVKKTRCSLTTDGHEHRVSLLQQVRSLVGYKTQPASILSFFKTQPASFHPPFHRPA